jgi:hypothetical protein
VLISKTNTVEQPCMKIRLIAIKAGDVSEKTLLNLCQSKRLDPYGGKIWPHKNLQAPI